MKRFVYLLILLAICEMGFSQNKLQDGIYLVDPSAANSIVTIKGNRAIVQFNPFFCEEDPDTYKPLVVYTDDFVLLKLSAVPVIQYQNDGEGEVLVQLTDSTIQKLRQFTTKNMMNQVAVVLDNEAIAVYKVFQPVSNGLIKIARCRGSACNQISRQLKIALKI